MIAIMGVVSLAILGLVIIFGAAGCASTDSPPPDGDRDVHGNDGEGDSDWWDLEVDADIADADTPDGDRDIYVDGDADAIDADAIDAIDDDVDAIDGTDGDDDADAIDGTDGDDDADAIDGTDGDSTDVEDPPIPGYNPTAYELGSAFKDLDVIAPGKIRAFGGTPLQLLECDISGIDDVTCHSVADMPTDAGEAVNYQYRPGMKSIAVAASIEENPIDIMLIDDSGEVEPHYQIEELPMPGFSFSPTRPGGIAFHHTSVLGCDRIFVSTANWLDFGGEEGYAFVQSTMLLFGDNSTSTKPVEGVGFSSGVNVTALASIELEEEGELRPWVIGINSGSIEPYDERPAAIDFMDPEPVELHVIRSTNLGAVELYALSEVKFNSDMSAIYMVQKLPSQALMRVDLASESIQSFPIDLGLIHEVEDVCVADGHVYMADNDGAGSGSILVADEAMVEGVTQSYDLVNASPLSIVVTGGVIAIAGDDGFLHLIDPSTVEWNTL
jgi:hypothetical protein